MAATYDYKLARPLIAKFFSDASPSHSGPYSPFQQTNPVPQNSIENIAALTPTMLNYLHDQLPGKSGSFDEAHCKANLLKWIRRNMSEYDTGYGARYAAAKLIAESMNERGNPVSTTTEMETPGGGGCYNDAIVVAAAAASQRGATGDVAMVDAYPRRESPGTISHGEGNEVRVKLEEIDLSGSSAGKNRNRKSTRTTRQHEPAGGQDVNLLSQSRVCKVPHQAAAAASTSEPGAIFETEGYRNIPEITTTTPKWSSSGKAKMSLTQQALRQIFTSAEIIFASGAYPSCLVEVSRAMTLVATVIEAGHVTSQSEALHKQGVHHRATEVEVKAEAEQGDYVGVEGDSGEEEAEAENDCQEGGWEAENDGNDEDDEVQWEGGDDEGEWEDEDE